MDPFEYAQAQHRHPDPPADRTDGADDWQGWCLVFVTEALGVGPLWPDAAAAWAHAEHRHPTTDPTSIPRGVAAFFRTGEHWHVVLTRGNGSCWTTDYIRAGHVDVAPIGAIGRDWGQLVGWTEDINGVRIWTPPNNQEDDMDKATEDRIVERTAREVLRGLGVTNRDADGDKQGVRKLAGTVTDIESTQEQMLRILKEIRG